MARMTIYVPDELKERMDRLGDKANWSAAAQRAFEQTLKAERWRDMTDELERAVARLSEGKRAFEESEKAEGEKDGRKWAVDSADYEELLRLSKIAYEDWDNAAEFSDLVTDQNYDLWDRYDKAPSAPYIEGFAHGALEVLDEVNKRL